MQTCTELYGRYCKKNLKKYQVFCMHHMRCTIFEGMSKRVSTLLKVRLKDSFDQTPYHLHVSPSFKNWIRVTTKEFVQTKNYAKGHGQEFGDYMEVNHPGHLLM